jgi:hypothetical protein
MGGALSELLPLLNDCLIASKYPRTNSTSGKPPPALRLRKQRGKETLRSSWVYAKKQRG